MAGLLKWDARSVGALSLLLWFQFMLFVDALTPVVRARFRFRKAYLTLVLLVLISDSVWLLINAASSTNPVLPTETLSVSARSTNSIASEQ